MKPPRDNGRFIRGHTYSKRTQFKKGRSFSPRTQFKPGVSASPKTQFRKGLTPHNRVPIGTVRIRIETHTGSARAWIKTRKGWRKRAVVVWEKTAKRKVPPGRLVHHQDRNTLNDSPRNLYALTRKEHTDEHRLELLAAMADELGMRLVKKRKTERAA